MTTIADVYSRVVHSDFPRYIDIRNPRETGWIFDELRMPGTLQVTELDGREAVPMREDRFVFSAPSEDANVQERGRQIAEARKMHILCGMFRMAIYDDEHLTLPSDDGNTPEERLLRTIAAAVRHAEHPHQQIPRRGPFVVLASTPTLIDLDRAIRSVSDRLFDLAPSIGLTQERVIHYDGWGGRNTDGHLEAIPRGTLYLIDVHNRYDDHQVYEQGDVVTGRLSGHEYVVSQHLAVYCNPCASTEHVMLPSLEER